MPPWFGPPRGVIPGVVALELMLVRTAQVAVCITRLAAYPTGFEFELRTLAANRQPESELDPMLFGAHRHRRLRGADSAPEDVLKIGVEFADGAKATNMGGFQHGDDPPPAPVMHPGAGGGGGGDWNQSEWVWPLPPPGPLAFVCEWLAAAVPLSRSEIDAKLIIDAAARAEVIFPDDRSPSGPRGSWSPMQFVRKPKPTSDTSE